jgi:hypothetical protein
MDTADRIYEEVRRLPEALAQEVLDFVGFIEAKHLSGSDETQIENLKEAQAIAMNHVWDNAEDEAWDAM